MPSERNHKKLLIVHQGALGDFVAAFPVLRALKSDFIRIDGICRGSFGELARYLHVLDGSYPLEAARFSSLYTDRPDPDVCALFREYHSILLFSRSLQLEESVRSTGSPIVVAIPPWPDSTVRRQAALFLADQLLMSPLIPEEQKPAFRKALHPVSERPPASSAGRILLGPGAGSIVKRWPLHYFAEVALRLQLNGYAPEMVLGPAETNLEPLLGEFLPQGVRVKKPGDLRELADLLAAASGYIGNDSAAGHLAAFLGVPSVIIFGPSDPVRWKPFGPCVRVVTPPPGADDNCMERIAPGEVLDCFHRLLGNIETRCRG